MYININSPILSLSLSLSLYIYIYIYIYICGIYYTFIRKHTHTHTHIQSAMYVCIACDNFSSIIFIQVQHSLYSLTRHILFFIFCFTNLFFNIKDFLSFSSRLNFCLPDSLICFSRLKIRKYIM